MAKTRNASEFKAKCLGLIDEVAETGEAITILKRGKPVARLVPVSSIAEGYPQSRLKGSVTYYGDVIAPATDPEAWEAESKSGA